MKKLVINFIILVSSLAFVSLANAEQDLERFDKWLSILDSSLTGAPNGKVAIKKLKANSSSRIAAFNVQALGKLYEKIDSEFEFIKIEFRNIENGLGEIDKWTTLKNLPNKKEATKKFAELLEKDDWIKSGKNSKIAKVKEKLNKLFSQMEDTDRKLLKVLSEQLESTRTTDFSFEILEEGNGLHEFRRQLRWFMIEAQVLNGLVTFKDKEVCPINDYKKLIGSPIAESKYATLNVNSELSATCQISPCLFYAMADAVEEVGKIKDEAEKKIGNTKSDKTPEKLAKDAEKIAKEIDDNKLLKELRNEIKDCY